MHKNNAWRLGLSEPTDKLPEDQMPPELKARRQAQLGGVGPVSPSARGEARSSASSGDGSSAAPPGGRRSSSVLSLQVRGLRCAA